MLLRVLSHDDWLSGQCHLTQSLDPDRSRGSLKHLTIGSVSRGAKKETLKQKPIKAAKAIAAIALILDTFGLIRSMFRSLRTTTEADCTVQKQSRAVGFRYIGTESENFRLHSTCHSNFTLPNHAGFVLALLSSVRSHFTVPLAVFRRTISAPGSRTFATRAIACPEAGRSHQWHQSVAHRSPLHQVAANHLSIAFPTHTLGPV